MVQNDVRCLHSDLVGSKENQRKPKGLGLLGHLIYSTMAQIHPVLPVNPMAQPTPVLTSLGCCRDDQCLLLAATNLTIAHNVLGAGI